MRRPCSDRRVSALLLGGDDVVVGAGRGDFLQGVHHPATRNISSKTRRCCIMLQPGGRGEAHLRELVFLKVLTYKPKKKFLK